MKLVLVLFLTLSSMLVRAQTNYRCFKNDNNPKFGFSVKYQNYEPVAVKYFGKDEWIKLKFVKTSQEASTTTMEYAEIYKGKTNGSYYLNNWGTTLYIVYKRRADGKEYTFMEKSDGEFYNKPCD